MKLGIYCIKDTAVGRFSSTPFMLDNDVVAKRTFGLAINSGSQSQVAVCYKDMQIWKLGDFDDKTGELTNDIYLVANGVDVKEVSKGEEDGNNTNNSNDTTEV